MLMHSQGALSVHSDVGSVVMMGSIVVVVEVVVVVVVVVGEVGWLLLLLQACHPHPPVHLRMNAKKRAFSSSVMLSVGFP